MAPDGRAAGPTRDRVASLDLLRGLAVVLMAVDHTRDYVHAAAMNFPPEDLAQTTAPIFLTRWITHFCAPAFMFAAGLGAALRLDRLPSKRHLSTYLVTRGLWLILLEVTVVRLGFFFGMDAPLLFLLVFWALGLSMIGLAGLIYLSPLVLLALSAALIALHNLADGAMAPFGADAQWLWRVLHQPGVLVPGDPTVIVAYPLVPWIAVMGLGYCCGPILKSAPDRRRRMWLSIGAIACVAFVAMRAANVYGDPRPWAPQPTTIFTLLSFLNTTKYPPSLLFLLMTLGPACLLLGMADRARPAATHPLLVFGRAPLFFFVAHVPLIHAIARAMTWARYGGGATFLSLPPPTLGTDRAIFPGDYGWSLVAVYLVWVIVLVALYPACAWIGRLKATGRARWLAFV